jgi:hypothetical protein
MRKINILLLCCAVSRLALAQGAAEPYHVKDDVLGETVAAYRQNHRDEHNCVLKKELAPSVQGCTTYYAFQPMTYANQPVLARKADFDDGQLYSVHMRFSSDTYDRMLGLLTQKFGAPASTRRETAVWTNGVSTITLAGEPAEGVTITFSLDALWRDAEQKQSAEMKKRKPDM